MMTFRSPSARGPLGIFSLRRRGVVGASTAPAIDVEQTTPIFGAPDLLTQAYGRVATQYRESNHLLWEIAAVAEPLQAIANALTIIPTLDDPDVAGGVNLTVTASIVGQSRTLPNGAQASDDFLRTLIAVRIMRNTSHGRAPEILAQLYRMFGVECRFFDVGHMAIMVAIGRQPTENEISALKGLDLLSRPGGVGINYVWYELGNFFGFADTPGAGTFGENNAGPPPGARFAESF